jgi:hypothetical protein
MTTDVTRGLDNLEEFKLPPGGFCGYNGPKWLSVKPVREVFADTDSSVFFLVVEFTPKKGDRIGPLFDGQHNPNRKKGLGPVWHVIRWDYREFKKAMVAANGYAAKMDDGALVDLGVQLAQNDGLSVVAGMKPIGIGPWPKRNMALMAMCDYAMRERAAREAARAALEGP